MNKDVNICEKKLIMKITVQKSITHCASDESNAVSLTHETEAIKDLFVDVLKSKDEYDEAKLKWDGPKEVSIQDISSMTLHNFCLEAERLGKKVLLEKRTVIQIVD